MSIIKNAANGSFCDSMCVCVILDYMLCTVHVHVTKHGDFIREKALLSSDPVPHGEVITSYMKPRGFLASNPIEHRSTSSTCTAAPRRRPL